MKRAVLEAWGKLRDDMEKPEVWAKAMRAFNPNMFIAPERAGVYREDMLASAQFYYDSGPSVIIRPSTGNLITSGDNKRPPTFRQGVGVRTGSASLPQLAVVLSRNTSLQVQSR